MTEETMRWMLGEFEAQARRRVLQAHLDYPFAEGVLNTEQVPPEGPFVLSGPATDVEANKLRHSAAAFRRMLDATLGFRQGVVYTRGTCTDLKVTATGADVNISVAAGATFIRGTQAAGAQGMYHAYNDAAKTINVLGPNPAHATLDRIDLVVFRVNDTFYSGATDNCSLEMVTGTPSGSPAVPAAPANSLILAQILVPHATAVIASANITDRRVPAGNGVVVLDDILVGVDSRYPTQASATQIDFLNAAGVATNLLPPGLSDLEVIADARSNAAATADNLLMQFNGDTAIANYETQNVQGANATASAAQNFQTLAGINFGGLAALNSPAATSGSDRIVIPNYSRADFQKNVVGHYGLWQTNATGQGVATLVSGRWLSAAAITRITLKMLTGTQFAVGSRFILLGHAGLQP